MQDKLTIHERHARLVKIVRRDYQNNNPGSRLFPNTSGAAWQGEIINKQNSITLRNPRLVRFGIPPADLKGEESGGADLLGCTTRNFTFGGGIKESFKIPIITGIEIKTGKSRLKKNQIIFRDWMKSINAIWYLARECSCWESWEAVYKKSVVSEWIIPACPICDGKGFILHAN